MDRLLRRARLGLGREGRERLDVVEEGSMPERARGSSSGLGDVQAIFVLGMGHSGTSILYNMLALHPALGWFSQYSMRDGSVAGRFFMPLNGLVNRSLSRVFKHTWHKQVKKGVGLFVPVPTEATSIWRGLLQDARERLTRDDLIREMRRVFRKEARQWGKRNVISKFKVSRSWNELSILKEAFPDALLIHIFRDGRAVVLSQASKATPGEEGREAMLQRLAKRWADAVRRIRSEGKGVGRFVEMRYEEFCNDVHGHLARILEIADLDKERMPWHRCPETLTPTNERWLSRCPEGERRLIEGIVGKMLLELGYSLE